MSSIQLFCRKPEFEGQKKIKKLVIWSFGGFLVWSIGLITWIAVFTINRYLQIVKLCKWYKATCEMNPVTN